MLDDSDIVTIMKNQRISWAERVKKGHEIGQVTKWILERKIPLGHPK